MDISNNFLFSHSSDHAIVKLVAIGTRKGRNKNVRYRLQNGFASHPFLALAAALSGSSCTMIYGTTFASSFKDGVDKGGRASQDDRIVETWLTNNVIMISKTLAQREHGL